MGKRRKSAKAYECETIVAAKCPVCGKSFIPAPYHVYRAAGQKTRVCSYSCMLESQRQKEKTRKKTGRPPKEVKL